MHERGNLGAFYAAAGLVFTVIALLAMASLVSVGSKAETGESATSTTFINAAPTVDYVFVSDRHGSGDISKTGFVPHEGGYKTLYVRGRVTDPNGCLDIQAVEVKVYRSELGNLCAENFNNCYATSTQTLISCRKGVKAAAFEVGVDIKYYADPTDAGSPNEYQYWFADVVAIDAARARYSGSANFEMNSLAAVGLTSSTFSYGTIAMGSVSQPQTVALMNEGNRSVIGMVRAKSDLVSNRPGFKQVSSTQVHVSLNQGFQWEDGFPIKTNADVELPVGLMKQNRDDQPLTAPVYFRLKMPSTGYGGRYSNELIFTAKAY